MRWIVTFFYLALAACSYPHAPIPQDATVISKENGFFYGLEDTEWLSAQAALNPATNPEVTALQPQTMKPVLPRLFPTHYDWPYWFYSIGIANTNRYK